MKSTPRYSIAVAALAILLYEAMASERDRTGQMKTQSNDRSGSSPGSNGALINRD